MRKKGNIETLSQQVKRLVAYIDRHPYATLAMTVVNIALMIIFLRPTL